MSFKLDTGKFKKISSDKGSTTLKHEDGHTLTINHSALSPKMREQVAALPMDKVVSKSADKKVSNKAAEKPIKMAEAGEVPSAEEAAKIAENQPSVSVNLDNPQVNPEFQEKAPVKLDANYGVNPAAYTSAPPPPTQDVGASQQAPDQPPAAPQDTPTPDRAPAVDTQPKPDPLGTEAYLGAYQKGFDQRSAGAFTEAEALGQQGGQNYKDFERSAKAQQAAIDWTKAHYNALEQERQAHIQDIKNGHIDPNRYMNSMGTGKKIGSAIGLMLGGMGGATTGQGNPAMDFMQKQIDRDIDAQKTNLNANQNLLSANLHQFGNLRDATDMSRIMLRDKVALDMQKAAASVQDPLAKAAMLQKVGAWNMETAPIASQMAVRRGLVAGVDAGHIPPEYSIKYSGLIAPNQQEAAFKELKDAQETVKFRDNVLNAFDQLNKTDTVGNRAAHIGFTPPSVKGLRDPLIASLSKGTAGRFTEQDAHYIAPLLSMIGNGKDTVSVKRQELSKILDQKMNFPLLKAAGIDVNKMGRYSPQGQSRIQMSAPNIK